MLAIDALLRRHSARALNDPAPTGAALERILEAATRAPDHGRLRPWRFIIIEREQRAAFGELLADQFRRTHVNATEEMLARERGKALRAPLIVVVAARPNTRCKVPVVEQLLSAGAAAHSIMLATFAQGFNAMWKTGDAAYDNEVKRALSLTPEDAIVGFLYLGTEVGEPTVTKRPDWREVIRTWAPDPPRA